MKKNTPEKALAFYGRYSTDKGQRETSIEDQFRTCQRFAEREAWTLKLRYEDKAISGTHTDRPGFQQLITDAKAGKFNILLVEDLSRLDRAGATKQLIKRMKFWNVRVIGVSEGFDSDLKGYKMHVGFAEMKNEAYIDDLREKTHRGLYGQADRGYNAGGRSYGYKHIAIEDPTRTDAHGRREVVAVQRAPDPEQADVVRRIFAWYAGGHSPLWIAAELNRQGIHAPRGGTWARSAIYGDRRSGVGILNNPLYRGQYIWNRSQWIVDPDSRQRRRIERPSSEWITKDLPELRIVDEHLWQAVQARMSAQRSETISQALEGKGSGGRKPKYLFSGLLKCGTCGANYILVNNTKYGCAAHKDRGTHVCNNALTVKRHDAEARLLEGLKTELLCDDAVAHFRRAYARHAAQDDATADRIALATRLQKIDKDIGNFVNAIRDGAWSGAVRDALTQAEQERESLLQQQSRVRNTTVPRILPNIEEVYRQSVAQLEQIAAQDVTAARPYIAELFGGKPIVLYPREGQLEAEICLEIAGLLAQTGTAKTVVAGAGFRRYYKLIL